ncbi:MAG: rRNA maturation RNase YbeY [Candidatus Wallbacteria bacterium]|nr:rRNA maturation RNase YbeY [Candidatus Wallbacteria bacterium]
MKCEIRNEQKYLKINRTLLRKLFAFLGRRYGRDHTETVSVYLVDNSGIAALNEQYLGHAGPTDVLAFPLGDSGVLGDIVVSVERACEQCLGDDAQRELLFLLIHGFLHLCGHVDYNDSDKRRMLKEGDHALKEFLTAYGK